MYSDSNWGKGCTKVVYIVSITVEGMGVAVGHYKPDHNFSSSINLCVH